MFALVLSAFLSASSSGQHSASASLTLRLQLTTAQALALETREIDAGVYRIAVQSLEAGTGVAALREDFLLVEDPTQAYTLGDVAMAVVLAGGQLTTLAATHYFVTRWPRNVDADPKFLAQIVQTIREQAFGQSVRTAIASRKH
jgi:hypothetical protein